MCPAPEKSTSDQIVGEVNKKEATMSNKIIIAVIVFCGSVTIASLVAAIILGSKAAESNQYVIEAAQNTYEPPTIIVNAMSGTLSTTKPKEGENPCVGTQVPIENMDCVTDAINNVKPQAGGNVTAGYQGSMEVDYEPLKTPYFQNSMCPVNVHWHLGAEHYSAGEYDESGVGPNMQSDGLHRRELAAGQYVRGGFRCKDFVETDIKFIKPYDWKHCIGMEIGETYEVHWPHSAAGACGTPNQYQTPFYDGVFCNVEVFGDFSRLPHQVGVQAQVFTIVNDETYYYPDLMRGMIVDGTYGQDIAKYTGSTTGTTRDNTVCSGYSPITWQVDRKCHLISASTFDKMCADMKSQRDDMSEDLYAHGSRELVNDEYAANNQVRKLRGN